MLVVPGVASAQNPSSLVLTTKHFAFHSDLATNFQIVLLRFKLAGLPQRYGMDDKSNLLYLDEITAVREAATPAYVKCRWPAQDALNRQWVDRVKSLLDRYETSLGEEFPRLFQMAWTGLPFRVDVVETAGFGGANAAMT